ncbi:MAG: PLP-dependent aminotransferase family protein [Vicinamibacterales bacterium]
MPRRSHALSLALPPHDPDVPVHRWLWTTLRDAILEGRLRPGTRLPGTRDLARQHGLARGTIVAAFDQLRAEGYLEGRRGSGTYVSRTLPDDLLQVPRSSPERGARAPRALPRQSKPAREVIPFVSGDQGGSRAFRANQPALDLFPTTLWAQVAARRYRRATPGLLLGCPPFGYRPLRDAIADYLNTSRGVRCTPDQVAVVSGAQEALDLIGRLLLEPGMHVGVEDPGYPGAVAAFQAQGAAVMPLRVDQEGCVRPDRRARLRLVYVTPGHQFPLGVTMSLPRRLELLEWAHAAGALVVEDDYDSEFRYHGRPVPALQGLDRHDVVLYVGSLSKVLFPALRLGYMVVPADLVDRLAALKSVTSRHAPLLEQAVLCDFMEAGHLGRHLRRMREVYAERRDALQEGARAELGEWLELPAIDAGLQASARLRKGISGESAVAAAATRGVEVLSLSRYWRGREQWPGVILGFAAVDATEIRRGIHQLATALQTLAKRRAPADD